MYAERVKIENFRNIKKAEIEFCSGVNVLVGENAQGKTNLLEALFLASVGRSFRAANFSDMIKFGESGATVSVDYKSDIKKRSENIEVKIFSDKKKTVSKNNLRLEKMSEMPGSFRAVLFCPEHLSLVKEGPADRRSFLDIAISRISPSYMYYLQFYNRLLKQRNAMLKTAFENRPVFDASIDIWNDKLSENAVLISEMRLKFIKRLSVLVEKYFNEMTDGREHAQLLYKSSICGSEDKKIDRKQAYELLMELYRTGVEREIAAGSTLFGIHKDDMDIKINGKSARIYGSQGQQRSLVLALKLAEGEICRQEFGDYPVFLFDDVLSELDETRRDYMILNATDKQVIISTCESEFVKKLNTEKRITVKNGSYEGV